MKAINPQIKLMNNKHKKHEVNTTKTHHQFTHKPALKRKNLNHLENLSVTGQIQDCVLEIISFYYLLKAIHTLERLD